MRVFLSARPVEKQSAIQTARREKRPRHGTATAISCPAVCQNPGLLPSYFGTPSGGRGGRTRHQRPYRRTVTSFFAIKDDLVHAGATWVDQEVVEDGRLITSRTPDDLPVFMRTVVRAMQGV